MFAFCLHLINLWFIFANTYKQLVIMNRIFIKTNDIATFEGITAKRASEIVRTIMDCFKKEKPEKLLIADYCQYRGIPELEIRKQIK